MKITRNAKYSTINVYTSKKELLLLSVLFLLIVSALLYFNTNKKTVAATTVNKHNINLKNLECYEQQK